MTYFFFYHLLKITSKLYFKKIRVYGQENVHPTKPLIICANHGNSFMDAILMAVIFKRKLHFLARADAFNTPFKNWFLSKINMMPIYRIRDGREVLKNNDAIFDKCQKILENNGAILIFPEGSCVVEKRLRDFKAGFVQMAYACKKADLQVLPVTINYSKPLAYFSEVSFQFQQSIDVQPIKEQVDQDYISFSKILLSKTIDGISNEMLVIPKGKDDFYEQLLEINQNDLKLGFVPSQLKLIEKLNEISVNEFEQYDDLKSKTAYYFEQINLLKVSDQTILMNVKTSRVLNFLLIPFYFLGVAIHYFPAKVIAYVVDRKIKEIQFKGAIRMILGMVVYLIYVPILFILGYYTIGFKAVILLLLFYLNYSIYHQLKLTYQAFKINKKLPQLYQLRKEIKEIINP